MNIDSVIKEEYAKGTPLNQISKLVGIAVRNIQVRATKLGLTHPNHPAYRKQQTRLGYEARKKPFRNKHELIEPPTSPNTKNILIIGDTHEPFTLDGYRDFVYKTYKEYKCTHVIHIGDLVDNHAVSYHESDPEGMSAGDELDAAMDNVSKWYKLFPRMDVILGNHDRLIMRKAFSGGIPRRWIMEYQDMFNVQGWNFTERVVYDDVQYIHGEGGTARARAKKDMMSTVQGHLHTQAYVEHIPGAHKNIFGMQVGCAIENRTYAMAYGKDYGKPAIGLGLVLDNGKTPISLMYRP